MFSDILGCKLDYKFCHFKKSWCQRKSSCNCSSVKFTISVNQWNWNQVTSVEITIKAANWCKTMRVPIYEKEHDRVQWSLMYIDAIFTDELALVWNWREVKCVVTFWLSLFHEVCVLSLCGRIWAATWPTVKPIKDASLTISESYWLVAFRANWFNKVGSANPPLECQMHDNYANYCTSL